MQKFKKGDRVFWTDPDEGTCSGEGVITKAARQDILCILKDDGGEVEALADELKIIPGPTYNCISGPLRSLLVTINGFESLENEVLTRAQRDVLYDYKQWIGTLSGFQTNEHLKAFDATFTAAGWDDQGLRWTRERAEGPADLRIVRFTNEQHTRWEIT
jgi:hypothetical protein